MNLSTRRLYPDNYEDIKQRMIDEYGQMMARKPQLVLKVIKGEDSKRREESSFKAGEEHKGSDKACHICGKVGHFMRGCDYYY